MQLFCMILMQKKNYKITVWRGTRVDAIATILEDFKNVVDSDPFLSSIFVYNKKDATFLCTKTGSMIYFMGTDQTQKVLGMRQDISFFNEISHFNENIFKQIKQRTRDLIFSDYNPSQDFFINKYKTHEDSIFLRSTFEDNKEFLSQGIVNDLRAYNPYEWGTTYVEDGVLMHEGEPVSDKNVPPPNKFNVSNGTADKYMWEVYGLGIASEKPNRIFKGWKTCSQEHFQSLDYPSYYGLDFGVSKPTAIVEVKYDGDRTFYVDEVLYLPSSKMGMPIAEYVQTSIRPKLNLENVFVCDSAKKTMVDELKAGGLRAVPALKGPGSKQKRLSQVQGINVVYTKRSLNLEEEYFNYSYKLDRYGLTTDEVDPQCEDHLMDAMGYCINWIFAYLQIAFA